MQNLFGARPFNSPLQESGALTGARAQEFSYSASKAILATVESSGKSIRSSQAFFHSENVSISFGQNAHRVFERAINASMSIESVSSELQSYQAIAPFQPPSPAEVASNVLGFVEARLELEARSGASKERLDDLLDQAREGVEKGFAMARDDIEALGLMTDTLSEEIDESFGLINTGLDSMESRFVGGDDSVKAPAEPLGTRPDDQGEKTVASADAGSQLVKLSGSQSLSDGSDMRAPAGVLKVEAATYHQIGSDFSLTTQDGDVVSIRFAQVSEAYLRAGSRAGTEAYFFESSQFEGYQVNVQGTLDEGEVAAINDLLTQVQDVSQLFFGGEFQQAFSSALEIGFDASEIAAFSLDLASVQVEQVRTYGGSRPSHGVAAIERHQPLIEMANRFSQGSALLAQFESQQSNFRALVLEFIERQSDLVTSESVVSIGDFSDYTKKISELLSSQLPA